MSAKNIMLCIGFVLLTAIGLCGIFAYAPWFKSIRYHLLVVEHAALVVALVIFCKQLLTVNKEPLFFAFSIIAMSSLATAAMENMRFLAMKENVLSTDRALLAKLGKHIIVGYEDANEFEVLLNLSAVRGVYLAKHNIAGDTQESLRQRIMRWQTLYGADKNAALWVATDQEGGLVSKLSPLLPQQPALSSVVSNQDMGRQPVLAYEYAAIQASNLSAVGINLNFSPVVDVCPRQVPNFTDLYSRISERCLGTTAESVASTAAAYSRALLRHGVMPTLKHFPGIGSLPADSHITAAHIPVHDGTAGSQHLVPFRNIAQEMPAWMMVAHVYWDEIDNTQIASMSRPVITGFLRERWGFNGVLITDDLNMGPAYQAPGGIGRAGVEALKAGIDVLLVSYDSAQYYKVMSALMDAYQNGELRDDSLVESAQRIDNSQRVMWDMLQ